MRPAAASVLALLLLAGADASAQFPWPTPRRTSTPTRTPTPTATPTPAGPEATPTPTPPAPQPTPPPTPPAGADLAANLLPCVQAPVSRRLGPTAKVEVLTSSGRWEIRPNPRSGNYCWVTVNPPDFYVSVGGAFTIRWSLGGSWEEVDAGVVVQVRATRASYAVPLSMPSSRPLVQIASVERGPAVLVPVAQAAAHGAPAPVPVPVAE